jgi:hypothetical protein
MSSSSPSPELLPEWVRLESHQVADVGQHVLHRADLVRRVCHVPAGVGQRHAHVHAHAHTRTCKQRQRLVRSECTQSKATFEQLWWSRTTQPPRASTVTTPPPQTKTAIQAAPHLCLKGTLTRSSRSQSQLTSMPTCRVLYSSLCVGGTRPTPTHR